jgi:hypothetical protein
MLKIFKNCLIFSQQVSKESTSTILLYFDPGPNEQVLPETILSTTHRATITQQCTQSISNTCPTTK